MAVGSQWDRYFLRAAILMEQLHHSSQLSEARLCELGGRGRNSCAGGPGYYLLSLFNSNVVKYSSLLERWCYALGLLAFLTRGRLIRILVTWQNRKEGLHSLTYFPICFTDPSAKGLFQNWVLPLSPWGFELWVGPNCLCLLLVILHRLRNF